MMMNHSIFACLLAAGLLRCGKSCRVRWINYLRADLKRGNIFEEEEEMIMKLHATLGNRYLSPKFRLRASFFYLFFVLCFESCIRTSLVMLVKVLCFPPSRLRMILCN
jgi:hypothetical protein